MTKADIVEEIQEESRQSPFNPTSLLGYILGALSLLNLVREFKVIKLYGLVKDWTDAFSYFILSVRDILFGWIKISWLSITNLESYFLVVMFLFISSYLRALLTGFMIKNKEYQRDAQTSAGVVKFGMFLTFFLFYAIIFLIIAIFALLLPNLVTLTIFSILVCATAFWMAFPQSTDNLRAVVRARYNLLGAVIVFLILVAVNYGFKP